MNALALDLGPCLFFGQKIPAFSKPHFQSFSVCWKDLLKTLGPEPCRKPILSPHPRLAVCFFVVSLARSQLPEVTASWRVAGFSVFFVYTILYHHKPQKKIRRNRKGTNMIKSFSFVEISKENHQQKKGLRGGSTVAPLKKMALPLASGEAFASGRGCLWRISRMPLGDGPSTDGSIDR